MFITVSPTILAIRQLFPRVEQLIRTMFTTLQSSVSSVDKRVLDSDIILQFTEVPKDSKQGTFGRVFNAKLHVDHLKKVYSVRELNCIPRYLTSSESIHG